MFYIFGRIEFVYNTHKFLLEEEKNIHSFSHTPKIKYHKIHLYENPIKILTTSIHFTL